jgi:hypothetical protein
VPVPNDGGVVIGTGTATFNLPRPGRGRAASTGATFVTSTMHFGSNAFRDASVPGYELGHGFVRGRGDTPIAFIRSVDADPDRASRTFSLPGYSGHRVRFALWARTIRVRDRAGIWVSVTAADRRVIAEAGAAEGPIRGSTDWRQYHVVVDVPEEATTVTLHATLEGPGQLWTDDFDVDAAPLADPSARPTATQQKAVVATRPVLH